MELKNICKSYAGKQVLNDFSCTIPDGTVCAILAPSGVGKTTLLRLILGLESPDSGSIIQVPSRKSALFQEDRLCPNLSVLANIHMAVPKCAKEDAKSLLRELGLGDSMDTPASRLSGGMARRAALARALLQPSQLLTLDEPFSGLDEANRLFAAEAILRRSSGRTVLLVTHREDDLSLLNAQQVIRLPGTPD